MCGVQNGAGALAMLCECPAAAEVAPAFPAAPCAHHFAPGAGRQRGHLQLFTGSPELSSPLKDLLEMDPWTSMTL